LLRLVGHERLDVYLQVDEGVGGDALTEPGGGAAPAQGDGGRPDRQDGDADPGEHQPPRPLPGGFGLRCLAHDRRQLVGAVRADGGFVGYLGSAVWAVQCDLGTIDPASSAGITTPLESSPPLGPRRRRRRPRLLRASPSRGEPLPRRRACRGSWRAARLPRRMPRRGYDEPRGRPIASCPPTPAAARRRRPAARRRPPPARLQATSP